MFINDCHFRCLEIIIKQPEFLYDIIPSKGTVFGLLVDGVIVRAVRENSLKVQVFRTLSKINQNFASF